eukprot:scaffold58445_cov67-Phaeocystis_antarctica.AAC.6
MSRNLDVLQEDPARRPWSWPCLQRDHRARNSRQSHAPFAQNTCRRASTLHNPLAARLACACGASIA